MSSLLQIISISTLLIVTYSYPLENYSDTDFDEISTRLKTLKTLLQKLDVHRSSADEISAPAEKQAKSRLPTLRKENSFNYVDGNMDEQDSKKERNMKHFIDSLGEEELNKLKMLRSIVDKTGISTDKLTLDQEESDNKPEILDDSRSVNTQQSSIAEQIHDFLQEEKKPGHIPAMVQKGRFLPSKDEIKYAVEKNLLTDVALALHSGISVNDLLKDLVGQTADSDMSSEQGEWLD